MKLAPPQARLRRHRRLRAKIHGTGERPRLVVFRSLCHIYAQVVDDEKGHTLAAASTLDPPLVGEGKGKSKTVQAALVGKRIAEEAQKLGITGVVFDRGGYKYHGRVKSLAEAARGGGLKF